MFVYLSSSVRSCVGENKRLLTFEIEARVARLVRDFFRVTVVRFSFSASVDEDFSGFSVDPKLLGSESPKCVFDLTETARVGIGCYDLAWKNGNVRVGYLGLQKNYTDHNFTFHAIQKKNFVQIKFLL